ncbi:MAG: AI-2E family transporter [Eubacteriales bacterium]|nr:AI-2E family transporter [Eubacteriales bacterium]
MQAKERPFSALRPIALALLLLAAVVLFRKEAALLLRLFLGAATVAFLLDPLTTALARRMPRPRAALCALLIALMLCAAALCLLFPPLARQFSELIASFPAIIEGLNGLIDRVNSLLARHGFSRLSLSGADWQRLSESLSGVWSGTAKVFGSLAGGLSGAVLSCFLALYFLSDKPAMLLQMEMLVPFRWRHTLARMAGAVRDELRSYLRGQALVCLCVGALSTLLLFFIGVRGALALGLLIGIANCIPYFGPFIGELPAVLCSLTGGLLPAGLTLGAILLVQQIDNMLLTPRITGGATGLKPPVVMVSVLVGGSACGWVGMLLAVPVVCILRCVWRVTLTERAIPEN